MLSNDSDWRVDVCRRIADGWSSFKGLKGQLQKVMMERFQSRDWLFQGTPIEIGGEKALAEKRRLRVAAAPFVLHKHALGKLTHKSLSYRYLCTYQS